MGKSKNTDKYGKFRDFRKDKKKHKHRPQFNDDSSTKYNTYEQYNDPSNSVG